MKSLLITGTDTGVGKTTFGCFLGFALWARKLRVGVMKPAESGCALGESGLIAADAAALAAAAYPPHPLELICPFRYQAPLAPAAAALADGLPEPDLAVITENFRTIAKDSDLVLVEGAGGITVPLTWSYNYADLCRDLELEVVLVVPNRLGALNATVLSLAYLERRGLPVKGYILNDVEPAASPAARTNADSLRRLVKARFLGAIRYKEPMALSIVEQFVPQSQPSTGSQS